MIQTEDDFHLLFIERQIQAGTNADFKYATTRSGNNLSTIFPELMLAHHQIKKRRQNPMLIEAHGRTCSRQRLFCRPSLSFSLASFVRTDNGSDLWMLIGELLPWNWRTEKLHARAA